jgi:hypothetical protein
VHRFIVLTPKEVLRATQLHLAHNAYDDMQTEEQVQAVDRRPNDPEDTDPIYRVVATPVNVNWVQPEGRGGRCRERPPTAVEEVELDPTSGTEPRKKRIKGDRRPHSYSTQRTSSGMVASRERSTTVETGIGRPALVSSSSTATVIAGLTPGTASQAESSRAAAARSIPSQSQATQAELARVVGRRRPAVRSPIPSGPRVQQRTTTGIDPQASGTRLGRTRALAGLGLLSTERIEHV